MEAFKALFESLYPVLCGVADRYLNDEALSKDIAQEAFIKLWDKKELLENITSIKSYLYAVVKNLSVDYLRSNKVVRLDSSDFLALKMTEEEETELIGEEAVALLYNAINKLPSQSSRIILLSLEGLGNGEISEKLGISVNSVKTLKYNALKVLRSQLQDMYLLLLFMLKK